MTERRSFPPPPESANALVLTCHPYEDSFLRALASEWVDGAREGGVRVKEIEVTSLDFDPTLRVAYRDDQPLERDLVDVKMSMEQAAHVVFAFPMWWGGLPATLKGMVDRLFLPGWAFAYEDHRPQPGLSGRTARILTTMDAPVWYDRWIYGAPGRRQLRHAILEFSGLKPVWTQAFGGVGTSTVLQRQRMLDASRAAGRADAKRLMRRFQASSSSTSVSTTASQ